MPLLFVAGFAIRGPLGIVIPAAVVISYYSVNRKWKIPAVDNKPAPVTGAKRKLMDLLLGVLPYDENKVYPVLHPRYICYPDYDRMFTLPQGTLFITTEKKFKRYIPDELKEEFKIIVRGRMGHRKSVAFRFKK